MEGWLNKFKAIFWGPSWNPGRPRLGVEEDKIKVSFKYLESSDRHVLNVFGNIFCTLKLRLTDKIYSENVYYSY